MKEKYLSVGLVLREGSISLPPSGMIKGRLETPRRQGLDSWPMYSCQDETRATGRNGLCGVCVSAGWQHCCAHFPEGSKDVPERRTFKEARDDRDVCKLAVKDQ